ncbi:Exosome complex component RRP45 [Gonapodya sp. JEL0774]|nr:Exosome complex component RRP45 [Gonapodya sp. JEL0774]
MRETAPSTAEKSFVVNALKSGLRLDFRGPHDLRLLSISLGPHLGHADVRLGNTRVIAHVNADVTRPSQSDPNEGFLRFSTECSPMADQKFHPSSPTSDDQILISHLLESTFRRSRAIDTEGLCIVSGEKVWAISVDIRLIDFDGNAVDAASIAAAAALLHFRRPDVTVVGEEVTIVSISMAIARSEQGEPERGPEGLSRPKGAMVPTQGRRESAGGD